MYLGRKIIKKRKRKSGKCGGKREKSERKREKIGKNEE
jgi:hypothetical protein